MSYIRTPEFRKEQSENRRGQNSPLIVEADGEYWHNLPDRRQADLRKEEIAKLNGWRILRFTDKEINLNLEQCVQNVLQAVLPSS